jgi:hypothetical protein
MSELTSLLNSTIQTGETVIEDNLFQYLDQLADGTYKTSNGSLTIASTEESVDVVTGSYTDEGTTLSATEWFTGQETASQSLIDLVTGTAQTGVYFAYDTDTVQFNSGPRTTVDCLFWNGDSVELRTFRAFDEANYATAFTEGSTTAIWDTDKQGVVGLELAGSDITLTIV